MPSHCAVNGCKNNSTSHSTLVFHKFSKEKGTCKVWITKCKRRPTEINTQVSRICSMHFKESDYDRDLQNELLGLPIRKILIHGAVPTVFPTRSENSSESSKTEQARTERQQKRDRKQMVLTLMQDDECNKENDPLIEKDKPTEHFDANVIAELQKTIERQRNIILNQTKTIKRQNRIILLQKLKRRSAKYSKLSNKVTIFSKAQEMMLNGQKRVCWSTQDILKALSLRSVSLKSYETARTIWRIPLPCPRTLRLWTHRFSCPPGIQHDVFGILKAHCESFKPYQKLCVLSYDEMNINSNYVLDKSFDMITSHSKVQVAMLRGLCEDWKQPIYFAFDFAMTTDVIMQIIKIAYESGLVVIALVSDLGGENRSLRNSLGITEKKVSFVHPSSPTEEVFVFADVPHLLKLFRNHLIDDSLELEDGTVIGKGTLEYLLEKDSDEIGLCPKFTRYHLEVKNAERMRVRPAAQIFSRHVSALAMKFCPSEPSIGKFFLTVNNGFDVLNARTKLDEKNDLKSGYGYRQIAQNKALDQFENLVKTVKFYEKPKLKKPAGPTEEWIIGHKAILPFQAGFLSSINAVRGLYKYLNTRHALGYMLPSRVNQDCLESFFSRIRAFGSGVNDNPSPPEFRYRFRMLLLGSQLRAPKNGNTESTPGVSYISAGLLQPNSTFQKYPDINNTIQVYDSKNSKNNIRLDGSSESNIDDTLEYIAGYIAWKLKKKQKGNYGTPTGKASVSGICVRKNSWISLLSRGGLLIPNDTILSNITKCEKLFNGIYNKHCNNSCLSAVIQKEMLKEDCSLIEDIVKEFVALRLKIRIKKLNAAKRNKNINAKKKKQFSKSKPKHVGTKM